MPITQEFYIDYNNKLVAHSTSTIAYTGLSGTFQAGETVTWSGGSESAIIVYDDAAASMNIVYETTTPSGTLTGSTSGATATFSTSTALTTVYTTRNLYTYLQDTFDELGQLDDTVPMSAQTPTAFTLINSWFIDDESIKYLNGGALSTSGWDATTSNDGIRVFTFASGGYTGAVSSDIGLPVATASTAYTGTLLHFDNTTRKWWVRVDDTGDTFDDTGNTTSVTGGTGSGTLAAASATGGSSSSHTLYTNLFSLGTIEITPNPVTYIFQNSEAIAEWWGRGDAFAHIDVLIKVRESGSLIDSGNVTVFIRHFGDLYDHFVSDLSAGGRQPVPLATQADINNNTSGEQILHVSDSTGFTVGLFIRGLTSGAYGEILDVDATQSPDQIRVGNIVGASTFTDSETVNETTDGLASGDTATTTSLTAPHKTNAVAGYNDVGIWFMNIEVDFSSSTGTVIEGNMLTGSSSGATCIFLGEKDATTLQLANWNGTDFTASEQLYATQDSHYYTLAGTLNQSVTNVINKAFEQGTSEPYSVVVDCANRTLAQVYEWLKYVTREDANSTQLNYQTMYKVVTGAVVQQDGEEYINAQTTFTPVKASPFGTFAGGKLFGAQGIWLQNMDNADIQNYQLTDNSGDKNDPPSFVNITVSNLVVGDRIAVFRTSGGSTIDRSVFTSASGNASSNTDFIVNETIPSDVPASGILRVVDTSDTSINRETRYFYTSIDRGTFTFENLTPALDRTYSSGADTAYVPYMDLTADSTSEAVTIIYSTNRSVLARVRRYGGAGDSILPFESTGTLDTTGFSVSTIRTDDSIVE